MPDQVFCAGLEFPEGPAFDANGELYIVETAGGRISRLSPSGEKTVVSEQGGGPNGIVIGLDGALYVTNNGGLRWGDDGRSRGLARDHNGGRIERVTADGDVTVLYTECDGARLNSPNDIVLDAEGNFYFTDPQFPTREGTGPGTVYYGAPDGSFIHQVETNYQFCNGIGLTDGGRTLVVAESFTRKLLAYTIAAPGVIKERRDWAQLPEGHMPDGFAFDSAGNCICAGAEGGALVVFSPDGKQIDRIEVEDALVTNVAFGGPDNQTMFVTESILGRVITVPWSVPGASMLY